MRRLLSVLLAVWLGCCMAAAHAAAPAAPSFPIGDAYTAIDKFGAAMTTNVEAALGSGAVSQVVNVLFLGLAISLFVWKFVGYALRGFDVMDIIELMLTIMFVYILLSSYTKIFPTLFDGARYIGNAIGNGLIGSPPTEGFARSMMTQFEKMTFEPQCLALDCLSKGIMALVATIIGWIAVLLLGIIAMLVELWTTWGFHIAYAIGWVMIPFMLYERLHFLFDGWLKFFFGMAVYAIIAKVNLALVFLSIQLFLGSGPVNGGGPAPFKVAGLFDIAGLLVFVVVGIFSLLATGRFAQSIVMGAGGGGIGGMVQSMAKAGANMASGGAGAIAGAMKR
jgi:hypothetical protein